MIYSSKIIIIILIVLTPQQSLQISILIKKIMIMNLAIINAQLAIMEEMEI